MENIVAGYTPCNKCGYKVKAGDILAATNNSFIMRCPKVNCKGTIEYLYNDVLKYDDGGLKHPLKNPDSPHYEMIDGLEAIEVLEALYTTDELKAWAKITYMKYQLRIGKKDNTDKEVKKMETFKAYFEYLKKGNE